MPAVTVSDITTLTRIERPGPEARIRPVVSVTTAPRGLEGEGFPVKRAFAGVDLRLLDPFIHMDEMGAVDYAAGEPKGTPWHPHRGFETVTYIIDGAFVHQDSHGGGGVITNGDTQWMTAGSGLLHIETPPEELVRTGGLFHGLQLWVNLPQSDKLAAPRYQDLRSGAVGLAASHDGTSLVRVIAGSIGLGDNAVHGPGSTHTPITMAHATVAPGASLELPWRPDHNALVYVMSGRGSVGAMPGAAPVEAGQLAVLGAGDALALTAADRQASTAAGGLEVVLLGGQPIREPIAWAGPFVMNTEAEVRQAFEDFRAGRLGAIPHGDLHA